MDTIAWIAIAVVFVLLLIIAGSFLTADVMRGAVDGHGTLERARVLLIVSTDDPTQAEARRWIENHNASHPDARCVPVHSTAGEEFDVYQDFQKALAEHSPDVVVWALHSDEHHSHETAFAMAKRELTVPIDAIYASAKKEQSA